MRKSVALLLVLILTASSIVSILPVKAEARSLVVPDHYSTIVAAIANANNGDTIFLRKGTYEGPINQTVIIDKTLSIIGENAENTIIKLYPAYNMTWILTAPFFDYSDAITITADACRLLNLTVIIANPGGYISATGNALQIAGNNITTSPSTGVIVKGSYCKITDNVMGGVIQLNGAFNEVSRNSLYRISTEGSFNFIKDNTCQCLGLYNSTNNIFLGNKIWTNSRSYSGIDMTFSNNNLFYKNQISGFSSGIRLWFSSDNTIKANTVVDSLTASINLGASFNNKIFLNNFVDNPDWARGYVYDQYSDPNYRGAFPNMTASTNLWDNGSLGNYWGEYNGTDANGDGVGDLPYTIKHFVYDHDSGYSDFVCGQDNFPLMARVDIDSVSIDLPEWALNLPPEPQGINPQVTEPISQEPESTAPSEPQESEPKQTNPFPVVYVAAISIASIVVACAGLLLHHRKRRREAAQT